MQITCVILESRDFEFTALTVWASKSIAVTTALLPGRTEPGVLKRWM